MGGRGSGSASFSAMSKNAQRHEKYLAGELRTRVTKNDKFRMDTAFKGLNYSKVRSSKSSGYIYADRVSKDGENIMVLFAPSHVRQTPYGFAIQLDEKHVQYVKDWQVYPQESPYKGFQGINVAFSRKYWKPKETKYTNDDFIGNSQMLNYSEMLKIAREQQNIGNTVSIRY